MNSLSQILADHVASTQFEDLSAETVSVTKWFLLDTLGVAWAGTEAPGTEALQNLVFAEGGSTDCTVFGSDVRLPATAAALMNGTYAGALDYDGVYEKGSVHPDIVTMPAAWAIAEKCHASGRDFIAALALGNDLTCRSGGAMAGNRGWFNTAVHGVFGGAAAASKLLGLDTAGVANAIGLAFSQASGPQQATIEKSLVKRVLSGMAARSSVFAALAAEQGITAPQEAFEGKFGFYTLYGDGDPEALIAGLGERYENAVTVTKKYPSCTANHVAIQGAVDLADEFDLGTDDVTGAEVVISPFMNQLVGADWDPGDNPQVAAQFSVQYSIACAIARRKLGIAEIQENVIFDDQINKLASNVSVTVNEDWPGKFSPCELTIHTKDNGTLTRRVDHTPGTQENPLSLDDLKAKFHDCAASGAAPMSRDQADIVIDKVMALEDVSDMAEFFSDSAMTPRAA
tara:strand:+ start:1845 stop:3215 length:1371 start_codon:yes stop_codon:yes gene_type:complete